MNISFIAKPVFFKPGSTGGVYPVRLSSRIRGEEIASFLGAEYSENGKCKYDIRIYVKPESLKSIRDGDYIDILDRVRIIPELKTRPKIKVIVMSKVHYDYFKKELENKIYYIPHHHINFENKRRVKNKSIVGGMVGKAGPLSYPSFNEIKKCLAKVGIEFKECFTYETRQDLLDFYNEIDFQVIWFFNLPGRNKDYDSFYRHPTKIANAASFGIPTIAQNIRGHQEFEEDYLVAESYEDIAKEAEKLKDDSLYNQLSERLIEKAKEYHISQIAKLYKQLK